MISVAIKYSPHYYVNDAICYVANQLPSSDSGMPVHTDTLSCLHEVHSVYMCIEIQLSTAITAKEELLSKTGATSLVT